MTTDPRYPKDEQILEQDLDSIRAAWEQQEPIDPPDMLNTAILNRAKRELESQKTVGRKWFSPRNLGAFATAAVVVVAFTLVIQQEGNAPVPVSNEMDGIKLDRDDALADPPNRSLKAKSESALHEEPARQDFQDTGTMAKESSPASAAEPELWIERLLALKESGDAALPAELAAFRATYPDYPLPPELDD